MRWSVALFALAFAVCGGRVLANDTMAQLGAGGLVFITTQDIQMASEDLSVSPEQVKVVYQFKNTGKADQHVLVAFPMPDITGDGDFMVSIPTEDPANIFGFKTIFNGKPVEAELHQYAFAVGIDQTAYLRSLNVPLAPFGEATQKAVNALPDAEHKKMIQLGMVIPMEYDAGQGQQTDYTPIWTLKSTYSWIADFPAGQTVDAVHTYTPSVGGTTGVTFLTPPNADENRAADYARKYCTDDNFINAVKKTQADPADPYSAPYTESWISYIWSTGANWSGAIGKFHLTVDKGSPDNLVSFCGKDVKKTGPTTFEMNATDFYPPYGQELEILILKRNPPENAHVG
ncbi:MAG TPA: DUF4424 domain-containing protein [Arsenicitalea sp.]|jgi:hypothetical protein|nr:DUF4424 domain-containing protein [Arsenicitalea sp.]